MKLSEKQRLFWDLVHSGPDERVAQYFVDAGGLPAAERIDIYRSMYWFRQIEALRDGFPRVVRALGDAAFRALCLRFIEANPSRHPSLERLGERFPSYVSSERPELADLALLEWTRTEMFLIRDPSRTASMQEAQRTDFISASLKLVPCVRVISVATGTAGLWAFPEQGTPSTDSAPEHLAVWRSGFAVQHQRLEDAEVRALEVAASGGCVAEICGTFSDMPDPVTAAF